MTDSTETKTVTSKSPGHYAYHVRNRESGDNYWIRIGSAWAHNDGNGKWRFNFLDWEASRKSRKNTKPKLLCGAANRSDSKMPKVARSMKNVKHLDTILNRAVENQVIFKVFDAE